MTGPAPVHPTEQPSEHQRPSARASRKIVYSVPDRFRWFHWGWLGLQAAFWVIAFGLLLKQVFRPSFGADIGNYVVLVVCATTVCFFSGWRMLRKKPVVVYDDNGIWQISSFFVELEHPIGFSRIRQVVRRSDSVVEFNFNGAILGGSGPLEDLEIRGNEHDLHELCELLTRHSVSVIDNPSDEDDPAYQAVVLIVGLLLIGAIFVGIIYWVSQ